MKYDILIVGSGPGGYVAAIRASQLGMNVAVAEMADLGGVCLNWGCIPTKALLKSAEVFNYASHAAAYGVDTEGVTANMPKMVERSRSVAEMMSKGIEFLLKKNNITVIKGRAVLVGPSAVEVDGQAIEASHIILATGARPRELPSIPVDGVKVINSRHALTLSYIPDSMVVIGSGAIGSEFAHFYNSVGTKVTIVEFLPNIMPLEDEEVSKQMERSFRKAKIAVMTSSSVKNVDVTGEKCRVLIEGKKGETVVEADVVLSAVGIAANIEGIGLEEVGVKTERGKVVVDEFYRTSASGIYAIGDIIATPALAHVASAEATCCVEKIAGLDPKPVDYKVIPSCIYTTPEVASVGITEREAVEKGIEITIGKFPYTASGKATAAGNRDGFVKMILDSDDKIIGLHAVGLNVTEMIAEPTLAMSLGATGMQILKTIHPHPTMSEAIMEAAAAAHSEAIHI